MAKKFESVERSVVGKRTLAGIETVIYMAPFSSIKTFPEYPSDDTEGYEERVTITEDFEFYEGECWIEVPCKVQGGQLKYNSIGTQGSKAWETTLSIEETKTKKLDGFFDKAANQEWAILSRELSGEFRLMGSITPRMPALVDSVEIDVGGELVNGKPSKATFKFLGLMPAYYSGAIQLTPATA